jgi:hypothetical protein
MFKDKMSKYLLVGGMSVVGLVAGIAGMAGAQVATTTTTPASTTVAKTAVDTPEPGDVADVPGVAEKTHGHAPLGGDGVVSSITGTTIVVGEESDEGGASYTVDASKATFSNNGVAGTISDIKVGEKIFVQGTTNGTNVTATSVSVGGHGGHMEKAGDTDGTTGAEASEPAGSTDASE